MKKYKMRGRKLFNIYYINYNKAFEIAMLQNNKIVIEETTEQKQSTAKQFEKSANLSAEARGEIPFISKLGAAINLGIKKNNSEIEDEKLISNIQVIQTKSILLKEIIDLSSNIELDNNKNVREGLLVNLNASSLSLENEEDVRAAKVIKPDTISDIEQLHQEGISFNTSNLVNSMLSDYFYLLSGKNADSNIIFKIPLNDSFESNYAIDDILIGNVVVVGIYKGEISQSKLTNTYNYLTNLTTTEEIDSNTENIIESTKETSKEEGLSGRPLNDAHFIDVIAIMQNITFDGSDSNE